MATEAFPLSHHAKHCAANISEVQFCILVIVQLQDKALGGALWPIENIHIGVPGPQLHTVSLAPAPGVVIGPHVALLYFTCQSMFANNNEHSNHAL